LDQDRSAVAAVAGGDGCCEVPAGGKLVPDAQQPLASQPRLDPSVDREPGVLLASIPSSRGVRSAGLGLFFTMMMLSGAGPPPEVLTGAMHWVSNLLPLTYMLRLLQDPWLALPWSLTDTAVVAAFTLGAAHSARLLFRWD
jgi:hypothetical protein